MMPVIFPQRDVYCRPKFATEILPDLRTPGFDMFSFAKVLLLLLFIFSFCFCKKSTLAEFCWAVGQWVSLMKDGLFTASRLESFFEKDLHEHWQVHLSKMRIRVADTAEDTAKHINEVLKGALVPNQQRLKMKVEAKNEIANSSKAGSKFGVRDIRRLNNDKLKTAVYKVHICEDVCFDRVFLDRWIRRL